MQTMMDTFVDAFKNPTELMDRVLNNEALMGQITTAAFKGFEMATVTIVATILLELYSFDTTKIILAKDKALYYRAVALNFINHYLYGIPVYMIATCFLRPVDEDYSPSFVAFQIFAILVVHSISYYEMHKTFHTIPGLYKYHKFHHRFHTHVTPMVANAVDLVEYLLAYVVPFALAASLVRPYGDALHVTIYMISFANLSIHTPKIEEWSERNMPGWLVSTHNHLEHHSKLTVHYGAPTLNVDWAVSKIFGPATTRGGRSSVFKKTD